ncbi:hypothetical protein MSG28_010347 [Choristoneura fumiferana]|uniref:Uncharacterized protein n=1 Tax=Choristoneura fumiferana TaxID=7141 RepID=A0ACC0KLG6_CHOFU|nr:hypothetical protein MSG28_010347 [Choristoneura fumiferana]
MSFPKRQNRPPVWLANLLSSVYSDKIPYLGHVAIDCGPPIGEGILLRVETAVASQISGVGNSSTVDRSSAISSDRAFAVNNMSSSLRRCLVPAKDPARPTRASVACS